MKNLYIYLFICLTIITSTEIVAQQIDSRNLNDQITAVDKMYNRSERTPNGLLKYKHIARYAYWWSSRVNPDGTFPNVIKNNQQAIREVEKDSHHDSRSNNAQWNFIGPDLSTYASNATFCKGNGYGRVDRVSFHPTNANKIYIATPDGGAWYSPDKGNTWECITNNLPVMGCAGVVVDPDDDQTLYLLTGTTDNTSGFVFQFGYKFPSIGVMKSTDHGENWEPLMQFTDFLPEEVLPYRIKMHPLNSNIIMVATNRGLFRSDNKGLDWTRPHVFRTVDIEFHPTDEQRVYLSGFGNIYYSTNTGVDWTASSGFTGCSATSTNNNRRVELAVSPNDPDVVYMVAGQVTGTGSSFCGYAKSNNKGQFYLSPNTSPNLIGRESSLSDQSNYDLCIAVDPTNRNKVVVGGLQIYGTQNYNSSGGSWTNIAPYWESTGSQQGSLPSSYVHPDVHDVAYNPIDGSLYAASDGGIYRSVNDGTSWNNISKGVHTSQIFNMNTAQSNDAKIGIGLQDNGTKIRFSAGSPDFRHVYQADGFEVDFAHNNSNKVVISLNTSIKYLPSSTDTISVNIFADTVYFHPVRFKYDDANVIYYGVDALRKATLNNSGVVISDVSLDGKASWEIETCKNNSNLLYTAGGDNEYRNDSNGKLYWFTSEIDIDRSTVPGFPSSSQLVKITDIATKPNDCTDVAFSNGGYVAGEKVYFSNSYGANLWQNLSYNLPNVPVHALEYDVDGNLYAGTEIGVFYLPNNSTTWIPFYNGMPRLPLSDLSIDNQGNKLFAATFGGGIYESPLPESCSFSQLITEDLQGPHFFETSNTIIGQNQISGGVGTDVHYKAGQKIELLPGFQAISGSRFLSTIHACGVGIE